MGNAPVCVHHPRQPPHNCTRQGYDIDRQANKNAEGNCYEVPEAPQKQPINAEEAARRYGGILVTEYGTTQNKIHVNRNRRYY